MAKKRRRVQGGAEVRAGNLDINVRSFEESFREARMSLSGDHLQSTHASSIAGIHVRSGQTQHVQNFLAEPMSTNRQERGRAAGQAYGNVGALVCKQLHDGSVVLPTG